MQHQGKGNLAVCVPIDYSWAYTPGVGVKAHACFEQNGLKMTICIEIAEKRLLAIRDQMAKRSPFGAVNPYGFWKRIKRAVNKGVLKNAVRIVKQATLMPVAAKLASKLAKVTGLPVGPEQISKAYDLATAIATRNPEALKLAAQMARGAALGNPKALAAIQGLRLVSSYVPAIRKVAAPVVGGYGANAPEYGAAPANDWREQPRFQLAAGYS